MSKPYHKRFTRFNPRTIQATKTLYRGWSTKTDDEKWEASRAWLDAVTEIYHAPTVAFQPNGDSDYYMIHQKKIVMKKPSIITLLHEFRHHLQYTVGSEMIGGDEPDARAWSLSLYYRIAPITFRRLARENQIIHVGPDLTNRESFAV